jgi:hypothetical protein
MHFYDLGEEPPRPRIGNRRLATAPLPSTVEKIEPSPDDEQPKEGEKFADVPPKEKIQLEKGGGKQGSSASSGSSSSSDEGRHHPSAKRVNENRSTRVNKRESDSSSSSESSSYSISSSSSSSCGSPPSSVSSFDDHCYRKPIKRFPYRRAAVSAVSSKKPKRQSTQLNNSKNHKSSTLKSCLKPSKPPPAKKVRFVMGVQERFIPSDDASDGSSHSSYDSYTDLPTPIEPPNASSRYSRAASARKAHKHAARFAKVADILGSEDGSCMDVSELPVRRTAPKSAHPSRKDRQPAAIQSNANAKPKAHAKRSGKTAEDYFPWDLESVAESNVDDGKGPSTAYQKPVYLRSNRPWTAKLRSGEPIPEPIFILRTDPVTYRKEETRPSGKLRTSQESSDDLRDQYHGRKPSPPRSSRTTAVRKTKSTGYEPPTAEDDTEIDVRTAVRFRDV